MTQALTRRFLVPSLLIAGLCLLGLGQAWSYFVPSSVYWGPEQAEEYATAQAKLHSVTDDHAGHSHGAGEHHGDHEQQVAAARERFNRISNQLERARDSHGRTGTFLTVVGVGIVLLGIALHFAGRRDG